MKNRIRIFISVIGFLYCFNAGAQNNDLYNIKLKSGLILKCEVVRIVPDSFVTIRQYKTISNIKCSDILSIEFAGSMEIPKPPIGAVGRRSKMKYNNSPDPEWSLGFRFGPSVNLGGPDNYYGFPSFGSQIRFCALRGVGKRVEGGISVGLEGYAADYEFLFAVMAAELRIHMVVDRPKTPFLYFLGGYGFNLVETNPYESGGANLGGGFGVSSRTRENDIFSILAGLRLQNGKSVPFSNGWSNGPIVRTPQLYSLVGVEIRMEWRF